MPQPKKVKKPKVRPTPQTKFQKLLHNHNVTQQEVAAGTGLKKGYISKVANGHQNYTLYSLIRLCQFLKCTPNDILPYELWLDNKKKK